MRQTNDIQRNEARFFRSALESLVNSKGSSTFFWADKHRHQVIELKNQPHMPCAPAGQFAVGQFIDTLSTDLDRTFTGPVQTANQVQQRGFTGAGRTHQRQKFTAWDFQVQPTQDMNLLGSAFEYFIDSADFDQDLAALLSVIRLFPLHDHHL